MRVVIVGGGVAGLALAAKLRQQGREPVVIEKAPDYGDIGYGIGLWPLGSCVLHGLGAYDPLAQRSTVPTDYEIADHTGTVLQRAGMDALTDHVGPMLLMSRTDLIDVLHDACGDLDLRMGTTVTAIDDRGDTVSVELSSGDTVETDLAVAADGIHSATRQLVFGDAQPFDTGWLAWTWWTAPDRFPPTTVREHWGAGRFFGFYPSPTRTMCCAGFPADDLDDEGADTETLRSRIGDALTELRAAEPAIDAAIEAADTFFRWPMADVRADEWSRGRVVLCGDAGVAFLPTAGVGASNALRSAAALADELSRADASTVPLALELYEKRCRKVVEGNQHDSRTVARYMFVESSTLSWGRDRILKHYPATRVIDQIIDSMHQPF